MSWLDEVKAWLMVAGFRVEEGLNTAYEYVSSFAHRHPTLTAVAVMFAVWLLLTLLLNLYERKRVRYLKEKAEHQRRQLLRGSNNSMTRKQRAQWRKAYVAGRVVDMFEKDAADGIITFSERDDIYRSLSSHLGINDLRKPNKKSRDNGLLPPKAAIKNDASEAEKFVHMRIVKNGIIGRMQWKFRKLWAKPMPIPGPKPPRIIVVDKKVADAVNTKPSLVQRATGFLRNKKPAFSSN
jgi:hypothetical protein